jgi:3-oxoacyl-[acyl-carrier-protein] synthase II
MFMASNWTDRRVVVTGLGVVSALGQHVEPFWTRLLAGQCGIDKITSFDASAFDCQIAAEVKDFNPGAAFPSPKELKRTDRFSLFSGFPSPVHRNKR